MYEPLDKYERLPRDKPVNPCTLCKGAKKISSEKYVGFILMIGPPEDEDSDRGRQLYGGMKQLDWL